MTLDAFREDVRRWLEAECPAEARGPGEEVPSGGQKAPLSAGARRWLDTCAERGFTVPNWPREYCGADLDMDHYLVLLEEMRRIDARSPLGGMGVGLIGPTLLEFGSDEQKARHLPKIARGEIRWCQGYSEPGAGSDLASLKTRAVEDGEQFIINGQKIWTSGADLADWMFTLTRTDPDAPKHEGISLLLLAMDQPGVTVRPIRLISGSSPFCETFFDDAIARKDDLVGQKNRGWTVGKRLLQHERSGIRILAGGSVAPVHQRNRTRDWFHALENSDHQFRVRVLDFEMRRHAFRLTQRRSVDESDDGQTPGPQTSIFELVGSGLEIEEAEIHNELLGFRGLGWGGAGFAAIETGATRHWLSIKRRAIARGSNEIQRNIIAKRVLGLPD